MFNVPNVQCSKVQESCLNSFMKSPLLVSHHTLVHSIPWWRPTSVNERKYIKIREYNDQFDNHDDLKRSMGKGKMMVEFFSAEIEFNVCKYRSCWFKILYHYIIICIIIIIIIIFVIIIIITKKCEGNLKRGRALIDDRCRLLQGSTCFLFSLGCDHLEPSSSPPSSLPSSP